MRKYGHVNCTQIGIILSAMVNSIQFHILVIPGWLYMYVCIFAHSQFSIERRVVAYPMQRNLMPGCVLQEWTKAHDEYCENVLDVYPMMFCEKATPTSSELIVYKDVSKNNGTPKSSIFIGFSIINHPFWGTPIFGNTHKWWSICWISPQHDLSSSWRIVTLHPDVPPAFPKALWHLVTKEPNALVDLQTKTTSWECMCFKVTRVQDRS